MKKRKLLSLLLIGHLGLLSAHAADEKEKKLAPYPLETCIVTDDGLHEMDEAMFMSYKGQTYGFCCKPCTRKFMKKPNFYEKKLIELSKNKTKK